MVELGTVGALGLSVASSVSIVVCNKFLITNLGFHFATTLTCGHLGVTSLFLHIARTFKWFEYKSLELKPLLIFSVLNGMSIGFLNLSLGFNSVGFYQMTKLAIIPCTVILQSIFYGKRFSTTVKASLGVLLAGVGVATVTDMQLNFLGSILSGCALLTTCVAQIWTNTMQKKYTIGSTQLLYLSAPYQTLTLLTIGPPLDHALVGMTVLDFEYTSTVIALIVLSCLIAISVNFSTFLVIGKCDAVTYQVLGHLKTCLVLLFGFVVLQNPASWRNISGILIAVVGMVLYAHYNDKETQAANSKAVEEDLEKSESK
mmetsp:Transcript_3966/g.4483  ORF Transcript_3966/g.4483 Transcript_3966/m.4483 type:complete len:315 (+) Transcript_3966:224-1168(+)|eukprot:CAMPEP_0197849306 /NCGR_PEP_ID=MMETSP1438-20131217/11599_1 /TAXON_ID=1461541 /ORGANISM="Pterosperma sp., Strain CCMP1384" /LENGTH=314 /DNA_ID=CAMNT_0043461925 /DNA_START=200 /DNA_END=1144 /DNA_ORIENTATION=+